MSYTHTFRHNMTQSNMITNFKRFVIESLTPEERRELRELGLDPTIKVDEIANEIESNYQIDQVYFNEADQTLSFEISVELDPEDGTFSGIDFSDLDVNRDFSGDIEVTIDFENSKASARGFISQKDLDIYERFDLELEWDQIFQNGDPEKMSTDEIVDELNGFIGVIRAMEDATGYFAKVEEIVTKKVEELTTYSDYEEEGDDVSEKKKLKFHHSNAPDAKGRFKELGVQKLADWLIRTRGGNMQKITGSLNQQINFNKRKNPGYAKKMERTREAVKRKLAKRKNK